MCQNMAIKTLSFPRKNAGAAGDTTMKLRSPFPKYSYLPFLTMLCIHLCTYYGTQALMRSAVHHDVALPIDAWIPFWPTWIFVYVLTFLFWIVCAFVAMQERRELCYEIFAGIFVAEVICFAIFVLYPSTTVRPELYDDGSLKMWMIAKIYSIDEPTNLFPSMHCMISWMFARYFMRCEKVGRPWRIFCWVMAVLICLSTQFVKQHMFIDLVSGLVLAELCIFLARRFKLGRVFMLRKLD